MADDLKHLLSGYAAEILSDDERRRLLEAALTDQEIFDELVEEESWSRRRAGRGSSRRPACAVSSSLRWTSPFAAWIYLVNRAAEEDVYAVVYPQSDEERASVTGELVLPPGKNEWLSMDDTPADEHLILVVATFPWPALPPGASTVAYRELEATLSRAERDFEAVSWRRVVEDDRVHLTVVEPPEDLVLVARFFPGEP